MSVVTGMEAIDPSSELELYTIPAQSSMSSLSLQCLRQAFFINRINQLFRFVGFLLLFTRSTVSVLRTVFLLSRVCFLWNLN